MDTLKGGTGMDTLDGGAGDDIYVEPDLDNKNNNDDTVTEKEMGGTDTITYADMTFSEEDDPGPIVTLPPNVENFVGSPRGDDVTGNASDNVIIGGKGDDEINLQATGGSDTVVFNNGDNGNNGDTVNGFSVNDDKLVMRGFSADQQTNVAISGAEVVLGDKTLVTLTGVAGLRKSDITFE